MRSNYYKWTIGIQCFKMFSNVISDFIAQQNVNKIKTVYTAISSTFNNFMEIYLKGQYTCGCQENLQWHFV
jgi:hypothetical protein